MLKIYLYPTNPDHPHVRRFFLDSAHDRVAWVTDPNEADFFYSPVDLGAIVQAENVPHGDPRGAQLVHEFVRTLAHYGGNEQRHFFHDYSAYYVDWALSSILFRAVKSRLDPNPLTISVPHVVEDLAGKATPGCEPIYDTCFVGRTNACPSRRVAVESVRNDPSINSLIISRETFWGYVERDFPAEAMIQRQVFIDAFAQSKTALAPRGVELDSYRFMEAVSAGCIPILMGDEWELPFENRINYDSFCLRVPESKAHQMNDVLKRFLADHQPYKLEAMAARGRYPIWKDWFSAEAVARTYILYLEKFLHGL